MKVSNVNFLKVQKPKVIVDCNDSVLKKYPAAKISIQSAINTFTELHGNSEKNQTLKFLIMENPNDGLKVMLKRTGLLGFFKKSLSENLIKDDLEHDVAIPLYDAFETLVQKSKIM